MEKFYFTLVLVIAGFLGNAVFAQLVSVPTTAVSFPKEVIPINAGKIEFWAKLKGFSGVIPWGGDGPAPNFFEIYDGTRYFRTGFNGNDGAANGGLVGLAWQGHFTGTGSFAENWTYERILSAAQLEDWHHYVFLWNRNGIPGVDNGLRPLAIYLDGVLNSTTWNKFDIPNTYEPLNNSVLNLIVRAGPRTGPPLTGEVTIDEFKIYDGNDNLILWNTLGSKSEIEHSVVGPNGSFNGGGNAHFVPGISGNAVMAVPVVGWGIFPTPVDLGRCCIYLPNLPTDCTDQIGIDACIQRFISSGARASDVLWTRDSTCASSCPILHSPEVLNLKSFNAAYSNDTKTVQLSWQILSEKNNAGFFIERSRDGQKFKRIEFLQAKPNSPTPGNYNFTDVDPFTVGYYRLVQLIDNGTIAHSNIVSAFALEDGKLLLSPNPTSGKLRIALSNMQLYNTNVSVMDISGRLLLNRKLSNGQYEIDVKHLSSGTFIIRINQNGKTYIRKFIKN